MVFGHNTNLKFGSNTLHCKPEDRAPLTPLIDTTVYFRAACFIAARTITRPASHE